MNSTVTGYPQTWSSLASGPLGQSPASTATKDSSAVAHQVLPESELSLVARELTIASHASFRVRRKRYPLSLGFRFPLDPTELGTPEFTLMSWFVLNVQST